MPLDMKAELRKMFLEITDDVAMRFASPTLLDIAKANAADNVVGLIDETIRAHPELAVISARTISGLNYKTLVRVTLPTVAFRDANEGSTPALGTYENRLVETFILNPRWECDKAVADRSEDGPEAYIALEASAILEAAMQHLAEQFYYGRGTATTCGLGSTTVKGDAKGFFGLLELSEAAGLVVQVPSSATGNVLLVDAGGSTADTGSSVYMVRSDPKHVNWVWGNEGSLEVEAPRIERVLDSGSKPYTAYTQELLAYPGLQVGSIWSFGRIGEITEDATCLLTDIDLANLWSRFPAAFKPNMILMSRRSQRMLRDSRIMATGGTVLPGGEPVPFPEYWGPGVPIHVTDAISDAEEIGKLS